jgi:DNA-binding transcriptional LysR family regulator
VESTSPAIQQLEDAAAEATNFARAKRGRIRVGSSANLSSDFIPESESLTASKRVRCIPISHPAFFIDIGAVWRRENMSPVVRWFIDYAVQMGREVAAKRSPKPVA